jgi:thymidylate synthase (FAD)
VSEDIKDQRANEIDELRSNTNQTYRNSVEEIEDILYKPFSILDKGFVRVVDYMGDDSAIVQAARVSYGRGTKKVNQDRGLIRYLMRHRHTSPFEMCEIKFHIKMPIFVARQWIRHRTANVNEYSARYSILGNEFYLPAKENLAPQSKTNRQGRADETLSNEEAEHILRTLEEDATNCYQHYQEMLNEDENGEMLDESKPKLTRELARMNLTLNYYTEMYWKIDLHNLLHFVGLRADSHAQYEIRAYAEAILDIVRRWVPLTAEAFEDYKMGGGYLSKQALEVLQRRLNGEEVSQEESGMSKREWREMLATLGIEEL